MLSMTNGITVDMAGYLLVNSEGGDWVMNEVLSKPTYVDPKDLNNDEYVYGVCQCPLPICYGHRFKKADYPDGVIRFKCEVCDTGASVYFRKEAIGL